jgi:hypothetical protein
MAPVKPSLPKPSPAAAKAAKTGAKPPKPSKPSPPPSPSSSSGKPKGGGKGSGGTGGAKDGIFRYVCEQHVVGVSEADKADVALAVGYKNPRSDGFSRALRELLDSGVLQKGGDKDKVSLTEKGRSMIPKDLEVSNDPAKVHERYIEFVEKKVKTGSDKVRLVWQILQDRKEHPVADLAARLGYGNPKSFGNTKILAVMREAGLVEGKAGVMFTAKVPAAAAPAAAAAGGM